MSVRATDFIRAIDESDLDPYEIRYLVRVWRRGKCWETVRTTKKTTGISMGKVSALQKSLVEKGWLERVQVDDKLAFQVKLPDVVIVHSVNADVHSVNADVHSVNADVHSVNRNVHVVETLPLIDQNEDHTIKYTSGDGASSPVVEKSEGQIAWEAVVDLIEFWEQLTRQKHPPIKTPAFDSSWYDPLKEIWIMCGRDVATAKARIQAVRQSLISRGLSIFDAAKLPKHAQEMIDRELTPMTERFNGNGRAATKPAAPVSVSTPAPGSQPVTW